MQDTGSGASRRQFLRGAGLGLFGFTVAGVPALLTPREACARRADLRVLTREEASQLQAVGEALVPGAADAGVAWYVDKQLSLKPNDSLLMARYFNVPPPYAGFYREGLQAIDELSISRHDRPFVELEPEEAQPLAAELLAGGPEGWRGPPAPLVYLVLRNDAVDVTYGTPEAFERLGIPYMAHILPPTAW